MNSINLTDEELLLLDPMLSSDRREKLQPFISSARLRIETAQKLADVPKADAEFIADVITEVSKNGVLGFRGTSMRTCRVCKAQCEYEKYTRYSRSHRKGQTNYNKPIYIWGVDLAERFIHWEGSAALGCCNECWKRIKPVLSEQLLTIKAEIPETILGIKSKYKKYNNCECTKCGWKGHEGQLKKLPALMGGYYPGECPECGAKNMLFTTVINVVDGWQIVEIEENK